MSAVLLGGCTWPSLTTFTAESTVRLKAASASDGDTFTALDATGEKVRIRLLGIDAPETADDEPAICGADQATEALRRLIAGP
ncbi:MAG: hypothetical protein WAW71_04340 [Propioniciclava sp.]|jgi:endonuclease YncB( thermonuclease family)